MTDEELFVDLAARLRDAHVRLTSLELPEAEKSSITKHFRAITDASKHDLRNASKRLDAFLAELDSRFPPS